MSCQEVKLTNIFMRFFLDFCPQSPTQLTDPRVVGSVVGAVLVEHPYKERFMFAGQLELGKSALGKFILYKLRYYLMIAHRIDIISYIKINLLSQK